MQLPKIGIIGYGSMGTEIHKLCLDNNLIVTDTIDVNNALSETQNYQFDVAIDFSRQDAVLNNVKILASQKKSLVIGTTGWDSLRQEVFDIAKANQIGLIYGSNFSLGVQLFFRIIQHSAELIDKFDCFDIMINEIHHKNKIDAPSGTALKLADIILNNYSKKDNILCGNLNGKIKANQLHITSGRIGNVFGTHSILIDSEFGNIELTHNAKSRKGFAGGAIIAAKWIFGKSGIFEFSQLVDMILQNGENNDQ